MPRSVQGETQDGIFDFLVGIEAALQADADASEFTPQVASLIDQWEMATKAMRNGARKEAGARAVAGVRDAELDDEVIAFGDELLRAVDKDRSDGRFKRYFKRPPATFVRIARMTEATTVKSWIPSVQTEPEPALAAHAPTLAATAEGSLTALNRVATAAGDRTADRVRVWETFAKGVDVACDLLHADLVKKGHDKGRPKGWADRFFPVETRARVAVADKAPDANEAPKNPL